VIDAIGLKPGIIFRRQTRIPAGVRCASGTMMKSRRKAVSPHMPTRTWKSSLTSAKGAVTHRDSLGNTGRIVAGDVQVMSAGTGIRHAEFDLEQQTTRIFQIWIKPKADGGAPAWGTKPFPKRDRAGRFVTLASGFETDGDSLPIRAEARVLGATLNRGQSLTYGAEAGRFLYLVPSAGSVNVNGLQVDARDGAAIKQLRTALHDSEVVIVDAPPRCSAWHPEAD
jgi:quercetin 2,3-dioxygenase